MNRTCNPALEDLETGFFLSLSLSLFAAVVFAAKSPFPPLPAISLFFKEIEKSKLEVLEKSPVRWDKEAYQTSQTQMQTQNENFETRKAREKEEKEYLRVFPLWSPEIARRLEGRKRE